MMFRNDKVVMAGVMIVGRNIIARMKASRKVVALTLAVAAGALVIATGIPQGLPLIAGGTDAVAELAARSPGARVGGVALKGKGKDIGKAIASLAPTKDPVGSGSSSSAPPAEPTTPIASVLGSSRGDPAVPSTGPFPPEFVAPGAPADIPPTAFTPVPFPPIGGVPIIVPGGPGGPVDPSPPVDPPVDPPIIPPAVPEPATWLMLIAGFGVVGSAMRRRLRVAIA